MKILNYDLGSAIMLDIVRGMYISSYHTGTCMDFYRTDELGLLFKVDYDRSLLVYSYKHIYKNLINVFGTNTEAIDLFVGSWVLNNLGVKVNRIVIDTYS